MSTDGFDLGDLPVPPEETQEKRITDKFDYNVAFKFAFVGVGQCGGRIAETFSSLDYGRVCAINTTIQDLAELKLDDALKLDLGDASGAGKDPTAASAAFADKGEDIFDLYQRGWGEEVDYAMVCLAAAGGTGAGGYTKAVDTARRYLKHIKAEDRVGAIVALPRDDEGQKFAKNALHTMKQLVKLNLSPVIFIDNEKIRRLYPSLGVGQVHATENKSTAQLLHLFNRLAGSDSEHTTFDRADFAKLLDSGVITFAADTITKWDSAADISTPIRDRLKRNVLATTDYSQSDVAALIYVLNGNAYDEVKSTDLDHGTAMFTRMLKGGSTVFPGVYRGSGGDPAIKVLAMIGGLPWPRERMESLASEAGQKDIIEEILGV